jgi:hypothetical protein
MLSGKEITYQTVLVSIVFLASTLNLISHNLSVAPCFEYIAQENSHTQYFNSMLNLANGEDP